jgi:hypothetical protein
VGQVLHGYRSAWLPASLLEPNRQPRLAHALFEASRHWGVSLHFNKGLAGAPPVEIAAARDTAINPAALSAFALAISAASEPRRSPASPATSPTWPPPAPTQIGLAGPWTPCSTSPAAPGRTSRRATISNGRGSDPSGAPHYTRLTEVKKKYDPDGLFFVHHGVGSDAWSADGFTRLA